MNKTKFAICFSIATAIAGCGGDGPTATSTSLSANQKVVPTSEGAPTPQRMQSQLLATAAVAIGEDTIEGQVFRIYQAAFDRAPDAGGLQNWIDYMKAGNSLERVSAGFTGSQEFKNLYGANATDEQFVTRLYANVLHRVPDEEGLANWLAALAHGVSREQVLIGFSESPENKNNTRTAFNTWFNSTQIARCTRDDIYAGDRTALSSTGSEYVVLNNVWNSNSDVTWTECVNASVTPTSVVNAKFDWEFNTTTFDVHSYPEILFGHPQGMQSSTTTQLPRQVSNLNDVIVTTDANTTCNTGSTCYFDTGFDLWFQDVNNPGYYRPSLELMVITDTNWMNTGFPETVVGHVTVGGTQYTVYRKTVTMTNVGTWEYLAYVANTPVRSLNLNLKTFIDDAKTRGLVNDTHYLDTIEFGTEVIYGAGSTTITNYKIAM